MRTSAGTVTFNDPYFNAGMKAVLQYWGSLLGTEASRYVLAEGDTYSDLQSIAWLSAPAQVQMVAVAQQPFSSPPPGQTISRGDQVGMFHLGGSTHCLVFQPGVQLDFQVPVTNSPNLNATNVAVRSNLATVVGRAK